MAMQVNRSDAGKSEPLGEDFCHKDHFRGNRHKRVVFVFENRQIQNLQLKRVPHDKLLTNLVCSSHTGQYWPLGSLHRPRCARSVLPRPRANIPQYGPRARLVRG